MFRDDGQRFLVCQVVLRSVRLEPLWGPKGPTVEALKWIKAGGGPLSSGEAIMLLVAADIWSNTKLVTLGRMLDVLDRERLTLVGTLLTAFAGGAVGLDAWLKEHP